ncbi:PTS system oligo-beta-mannoside-specific EIIC component [Anoxybacillus ayderensis]|uniref:Permease IIC component n=1 Tax=Anoxybacillus ayderensis TaxID=265546 RepID=A0A0D0HLI1_9BACL|nr:PTS cellobiose transporter subunit IIC [Anoxybacillus ayderensis]KIP21024.1 PTS system oligo-beta-mannoside-specific EIIC component [Anoxybacillus ayderensis]
MQKSWFDAFSRFLVPIAGKLNNNRYLKVLRDAFMLAFPLTIFGSIAVVLANLPFLDRVMSEGALNTFRSALNIAPQATMGIMSIFVVFGIGYYLSKSYEIEAIFGGAIALVSFLLLTPFFLQSEGQEVVQNVIPLDRLGAKGMFLGMIVAFTAGEMYRWAVQRDFTIKMPAGVPPAVSRSFSALIPTLMTLSVFLIINIVVTQLFKTNMHDVVYHAIQAPLVGLGSGIVPTLIAVFVTQILWFFGLHGQIIINSVMDPIWNTLSLENLNAYMDKGEVPHVISKQFIEIYTVGMGGTGMTLAVVVAMLLFMKSKQLKQVGKLAIGPGIFNVNEPVIFGLPIVMNPLILFPWIVAPMVVTLVTYLAMSTGIVPPPTGVAVPWTVPILINGIMATNSIAGGLLQLVNFTIVLAIWFPFLKFIDRMNLQKEREEGKGESTQNAS